MKATLKVKKCKVCSKIIPAKSRKTKFCSEKCFKKNVLEKYGKPYQQKKYQEKLSLDPREKIKCEVCGLYFRQVGTHVVQSHGYESAREYREEYGFDLKKGQLPKDLKAIKREHVFINGTVKNLKKGKKFYFKKGKGQKVFLYKRSRETLERLSGLYKLTAKFNNSNKKNGKRN